MGIQEHVGDSYQVAWCQTRWSLYGFTGTPSSMFDGTLERRGAITNDSEMFAWYKEAYNQRAAIGTAIGITITAEEIDENVYEVISTLTMDEGADTNDFTSHIVKAIDYYPASSDDRYRNCTRGHREADYTMEAGQSYQHVEVFTLNSTDISHLTDLKFVAFVARDNATHVIKTAEIIDYPFPEPQEDILGDVDGDGDVDLSDLASMLAVYGLCDGEAGYIEEADFVDDGCINLSDLAALLSNYGYSG